MAKAFVPSTGIRLALPVVHGAKDRRMADAGLLWVRHGAINPAGRVRSFNTNALIGNEHWARQLGMERDYLLLKAASASRPSGERFPDHAALLIVACDGKATPHPFLAEAQDAPQLSPTFPTQTVVCTGDAQNTAEWVVRCAKLWNAESPTRRLTRNGSDSYAPWWRQF